MTSERHVPDPIPAGARRRFARAVPIVLLALSGCAGGAEAPATSAGAPPALVRLATADRSPRPVLTEVVGSVRSVQDATIAPLVSGTVTEMRARLGSSVRAGDVLVRISAREADARLEQARAVSALAARERDRAVTLMAQGAMPVAQYEAALSQWGVAQAQEAEASTVAERTVVRAPFAGVITAKLAHVGDTALPGRPLLTLESREATRFEAQIPETASDDLAIGQRVRVRVEGPERELEGRVAEIQPASDDATRTRLLKIDLPRTPGLRSGQFGRVFVTTGRAVAVTVPAEAVVRHGQLESVFVVDGGAARLRLVRCGREVDGRVPISAGLSGGEHVALGADLVDGQPVRVEQSP